jgi:hypothetical protein
MIGSTLVQALPSLLKLAQALTGARILRQNLTGANTDNPSLILFWSHQYVIMPHHHDKDG